MFRAASHKIYREIIKKSISLSILSRKCLGYCAHMYSENCKYAELEIRCGLIEHFGILGKVKSVKYSRESDTRLVKKIIIIIFFNSIPNTRSDRCGSEKFAEYDIILIIIKYGFLFRTQLHNLINGTHVANGGGQITLFSGFRGFVVSFFTGSVVLLTHRKRGV